MKRQSGNYRLALWVFGILFILSTCLLLLSASTVLLPGLGQIAVGQTPTPTYSPTPTEIVIQPVTPFPTPTPSGPIVGPVEPNSLTLVILPFITSVLSLLGLVSTTILAWRKERRETEELAMDKERQRIELEKAKLELEKLKAELDEQKGKKRDKSDKTP